MPSYYLSNTDITALTFEQLAETAPASLDEAQGWTVDKKTALASPYKPDTTQGSGTFVAEPSAFGGLGYRSINPINGMFAAGNWVLAFKVKCNAYYAQKGYVKFRFWRSANANGSGATQITPGWQSSAQIGFTAANQYQTGTITWAAGNVSLQNEYLFLEIEWYATVSGGNNSANVYWAHNEGAAEKMDSPILIPTQTVAGAGNIGSAEQFGSATLAVGPTTINLSGKGIASKETFGTTKVNYFSHKKGVVIDWGAASNEVDYGAAYYGKGVWHDGWFWFYYTGIDSSGNPRICLALSKNGFDFVKKGVVLPKGAAGEMDGGGCLTPCPVVKDNYIWLYYMGRTVGGYDDVMLALSKDGFNFVKKGIVIPTGGLMDSDSDHTRDPSVLVRDNHFWMFYTGMRQGGWSNINLAFSKDGINFVKKGVVVPSDVSGDAGSAILFKDNFFSMPLAAIDAGGTHRIALVFSKDGFSWKRKGIVVPLGKSNEIDGLHVFGPGITHKDDRFWIHYAAAKIGGEYRIALALARDAIMFEGVGA